MAKKEPEDRLTALESFTAVAHRLSFVAASDELGVSASALSRRIAQLEASLGTRLFHRTTRKVSLTEAGVVYLRYVIVDLISEGYDVAVRVGTLESSNLVARRLAPNRRLLCASPECLAHHGEPTDPHELVNHACLQVSTYRSHDWRLQRDDETIDVAISPVMRADNAEALRQAALAGCGITLMPTFIVGDDMRARRLVQILSEWQATESWVWALYPHTRFLPLKVRAFVDFLVAEFGDVPPWDA